MATWPTSLPAPQSNGYSVAPADPSLRTDMEAGAARSRRRTYARDDRVSVGWLLTDAQMDTFRAWFDDDAEAAGGSAWFYISLPLGDGGLTLVEARFVGMYRHAIVGVMDWSVTAQLEVR